MEGSKSGKGKVKWFNNKKGFGFIIPENESEEIFVHYSVIEKEGFKTIKQNMEVNYEAVKTEKGYKATKVIPPPRKKQEQPAKQS
ncbi:MAG: cold-shock protein [Elusimicrobiales bacterium]